MPIGYSISYQNNREINIPQNITDLICLSFPYRLVYYGLSNDLITRSVVD